MNVELKVAILKRFRTQEDFSQAIGENSSLVSKVVQGRRSLPPEKCKAWAKALGVKSHELFQECR
jgi:DNA-binding transcriptional regulator YdaS (Cro superfamily)